MRRTAVISLIALLAIASPALTVAQETEPAAEETKPAAEEIKFAQPALISSAGQSADVKLAGMMAKRLELDAKVEIMAVPDNLDGMKTLIIVPGFSSKGLGAAGISQADEMARVIALVDAANEKGIPILMLHIGGKARRMGQSDAFNELAAKNAKYMVVVAQGNEDGFFTTISEESGTPMEVVAKIPDAMQPLEKLFE